MDIRLARESPLKRCITRSISAADRCNRASQHRGTLSRSPTRGTFPPDPAARPPVEPSSMRRPVLLSLTIALPCLLTGCTGMGVFFDHTFSSFDENPNTPAGSSETLQRIRGESY